MPGAARVGRRGMEVDCRWDDENLVSCCSGQGKNGFGLWLTVLGSYARLLARFRGSPDN